MAKSGSTPRKKPSTQKKKKPRSKNRSVDTSEEDGMRTCDEGEQKPVKKSGSGSLILDATVEERSFDALSPIKIKRSESVASIQPAVSKTLIPPTYFHVVDVDYEIPQDYQHVEASMPLTLSLVVISISPYSPFFPYLLVGDQILEINGTPILTLADFKKSISTESGGTLRVVRPWNITHMGERQPKKKVKNYSYAVVEIHQLTGKPRGLGADIARGGLVRNIKPKENAAHGFIFKDRVLDVEQVPMKNLTRNEVRLAIDQSLTFKKKCTFLVERPPTLRSSPNASLTAARLEAPQVIGMGDDACEIGAREATRIREMKDRYRLTPVCKVPKPDIASPRKQKSVEPGTRTVTEDEGEKKKKTKRKKGKELKKSVSIADRSANSISHTPSDVKDTSKLLTVGPNRSTFFRTFSDRMHPTKKN